MRVLICGGGVIGTSIAYFLARREVETVVIERCEVACAASGKSGGFLALDWCDGTPVSQLARRSFALHGELAESLGGARWGYRRLDTLGVLASVRRDMRPYGRLDPPDWLDADVAVTGVIGTAETTAQIDSAKFTRAMMDAAVAHGAQLVSGEVTGVARTRNGALTGVAVDGREISGDAVVFAMGPWSVQACQWLPLPAVIVLKGHSLVFLYEPPSEAQALFVEMEMDDGALDSPEVIPRPDGTTYVCGLSEHDALPEDPARVATTPEASERLRAMAARVAPDLAAAEMVAAGACYRPVTQDGLPLIGRVPGVAGAYLATGHASWGMLCAPATGEAMAELILDGAAKTLDLSPFDPARLPALDPAIEGTNEASFGEETPPLAVRKTPGSASRK